MAFLANSAVNRVNLHYGVMAAAQSGGGVFFLVFLLRAGVPIPASLASLAAIQALRFVLRPAILPLTKRVGIKPVLIAGTLFLALQYQVLAAVHGVGGVLAGLWFRQSATCSIGQLTTPISPQSAMLNIGAINWARARRWSRLSGSARR